ncbi:MAG: hypothetical protein JXR76_26520 [Deltaproteobacteria bacterium]|nr:hypothetical protein [Deltaproteobacteria bacterium]
MNLYGIGQGLLLGVLLMAGGCGGATFGMQLPASSDMETDSDSAIEAHQGNDTDAPQQLTVDLFIMSQCPYGVETANMMIEVARQFAEEMTLHIEYVGAMRQGQLTSMHGDSEIQGDIDQLCAKASAPSLFNFYRFIRCVNEAWRQIPARDAACAEAAGLDVLPFLDCSEGERGRQLLEDSFRRTAALKAMGSPEIHINGELYTGARSKWAILNHICHVSPAGKDFETCATLPAPPTVSVLAITDRRCGEACDVSQAIESLRRTFPGIAPRIIDWSQPEAKKRMKSAGLTRLPALLLSRDVEKDAEGFADLDRWVSPAGPYYSVEINAPFDPGAEICDNRIDDTGNGLVDCADDTCAGTMGCRKTTERTVELFVMSQCPFGAMALLAMKSVLGAFKPNEMDFQLHFIATENNGQITSMHGAEEVVEDMRWLCAKSLYPRKYLDFVWCRAADLDNPAFEKCLQGKMSARQLSRCVDGEQGKRLLRQDMTLSQSLEIGASPTWIVNGRNIVNASTPRAIQTAYCEENPGLAGCEKVLSDDQANSAADGACGK